MRGASHPSLWPCGDNLGSNPYAVLGLENSVSDQKLIKRRARALLVSVHPDKNPENEYAQKAFTTISSAFDFLSDPAAKERCDQFMGALDWSHVRHRPYKPDRQLLASFYQKRRKLQRVKETERIREMAWEYIQSVMKSPSMWLRDLIKSLGRSYKLQSGRVWKSYRNLKRRFGARDQKSDRTSKMSGTSPAILTGTKAAGRSHVDGKLTESMSRAPIPQSVSRKTFTITASETVTKEASKTETITVLGMNAAKHYHDFGHFVRTIAPEQLFAGAAVAAGCAAGCYFLIRCRQARNTPHEAVDQEIFDFEEDVSDQTGSEKLGSDEHKIGDYDEVMSDDNHDMQLDRDGLKGDQSSEFGEGTVMGDIVEANKEAKVIEIDKSMKEDKDELGDVSAVRESATEKDMAVAGALPGADPDSILDGKSGASPPRSRKRKMKTIEAPDSEASQRMIRYVAKKKC